MDKTTVTKLLRVAWRTVGTICERVVAEELDPNRLDDLFILGVDEISYRKRHNYLTLVTNHETGKIVYGAEGKSAKSLDEFFDDLGKERTTKIKAAHHGSRSEPLPRPLARRHLTLWICLDPLHVVKFQNRGPRRGTQRPLAGDEKASLSCLCP